MAGKCSINRHLESFRIISMGKSSGENSAGSFSRSHLRLQQNCLPKTQTLKTTCHAWQVTADDVSPSLADLTNPRKHLNFCEIGFTIYIYIYYGGTPMRHRKTACFEALVLEPHFVQSCGRFLLLYCLLG